MANSLDSSAPDTGHESPLRPLADRRPLWGIWMVYSSSHNVLWRDEVRALTVARESKSISELFANLHDEGHSALWYLSFTPGPA